jgi:hypothetical protein
MINSLVPETSPIATLWRVHMSSANVWLGSGKQQAALTRRCKNLP